jgi:hypothetical protein
MCLFLNRLCFLIASSQSLLQKRGKSSGWLVQCHEPLAEHIYSFRGDLLENKVCSKTDTSYCVNHVFFNIIIISQAIVWFIRFDKLVVEC